MMRRDAGRKAKGVKQKQRLNKQRHAEIENRSAAEKYRCIIIDHPVVSIILEQCTARFLSFPEITHKTQMSESFGWHCIKGVFIQAIFRPII